MGLNLCVGELDEDALRELNDWLEGAGLPPHREPAEVEPWSCDLPGYGALHTLRRVAAHLQYEKRLPARPGDEDAASDPLLGRYYAARAEDGRAIGLRQRAGHNRRFDHLIFHSDCEGYYLPRNFETVLQSDDLVGLELGSLVQLQKELQILRAELRIPEGARDPESELSREFGLERYVCVALLEGCRRALESGAALVFT